MSQRAFVAALLDPNLPVPPGLSGSGQRFAVYRNTVAVGLTGALRQGFPVVCKLVGDDFFAEMARVFARQHPPRTRIMMLYGADFAAFLAEFSPVAGLPYLPDVARLEQAIRESYHAADAAPAPPETLAALPEARLLQSRLGLAPAVRLVRSHWPIHAIWATNTTGGVMDSDAPQDVVVIRPDYDPVLVPVTASAGQFIAELLAGRIIADALVAAGPDLDLTAVLTVLLQGKAVVAVADGSIQQSMSVHA